MVFVVAIGKMQLVLFESIVQQGFISTVRSRGNATWIRHELIAC